MKTLKFSDYVSAALLAASFVIPGCAKSSSNPSHLSAPQNPNSPVRNQYNVRDGIEQMLNDYDNTVLVIGDQAPSSDVISGIDIATRLQSDHTSRTGNTNGIAGKLSTEVINTSYDKNMVIVGKEQDNPMAELLRSSLSAQDRQLPNGGTSVVECYELTSGKFAIVITATDSFDIRKGCRAVAQYDQVVNGQLIDLNGKVVYVQGTSLSDISTQIHKP